MTRAQIYAAVLAAMQEAEELEGVDGDEYLHLMEDIAREAQRRAKVYTTCADCGGSTAYGTPDPHECGDASRCDFQPVGEPRCNSEASDIAIDETGERVAHVCEYHAAVLASDRVSRHWTWTRSSGAK